jgi:hypothetical protein
MSSCPDHLTQRSLKITNYIKVQGPSASRKLQASPPPTATTNPSPAANDEEESLAITDLKEPHRHEALKRAAIDTRHRGRDEDAVGRTSAGDAPRAPQIQGRSSLTALAVGRPSSIRSPACRMTHSRCCTLDEARLRHRRHHGTTERQSARTPVQEPAEPDSTSTCSSPAPE